MTYLEMQQRRAEIAARTQTLASLEAAGTGLSAEQLGEVQNLQAEFDSLTQKMERQQAAEKMAAAAATQVTTAPVATPTKVPATPAAPAVKGAGVARMVSALVQAQGNYHVAADIADKNGYGADVAAALSTATPGAGGVLIPSNMSQEVIELLRPKAVIRKMGTRSVPLNNGNLTIPRLKGGASVGYIGTDGDAPTTEASFDDLKLSSKKMAALVPISNDLLAYSGVRPGVDQLIVGDLTSAIGAREDKAFIRDDGTGNLPKGLRFWCIAGNQLAAPAIAAIDAAALQAIEVFLNSLILLLEGVDANMVTPGWLMSPRTFRFLEGLKDLNGNKVYPEMAQGLLKGYPIGKTTQIPNNLGQTGKESELYFVDFNDCFIGEDETLMIDFSKEATYKDSDGNMVSAFQRDQTLVRVISKHDFGPRHVESIAVGTGVTWGA